MMQAQSFASIPFDELPGLSNLQDMQSVLKTVAYLTGTGIRETLDLDPQTSLPNDVPTQLRILDSIAELVPLYNNFMKGMAEDGIQRMISNSRDLGVQATAREIWNNAAFGFKPTRQRMLQDEIRSYYWLRDHVRRAGDKQSPEGSCEDDLRSGD